MKIYLAGKITGDTTYRQKFAAAEQALQSQGHTVMNPAVLNEGFSHPEYMKICLAMQSVCDATLFLPDWTDSKGARIEMREALQHDMPVFCNISDIPAQQKKQEQTIEKYQ